MVISQMELNKVKKLLIKQGFKVEENRSFRGNSGIKHSFPLLALRGSNKIVIEFSEGLNLERDIVSLYVRCMDIGIRERMLILVKKSKIDDNTLKLASKLGIKLVNLSDWSSS